jgi:hypothetical protein
LKYSILKYVTERSDELASVLLSCEDVLICSPTDSGKTFAIIDFANRNSQLRIAFLMPTRYLVNNIKQDYKEINSLRCGYGKQFAKDYKGHRFICTTYDSYTNFEKPFDIVIIDEAHNIGGHGNFRTEALAPLLKIKCKKVLLTGTPEIIENLEGFQRIDFIRKSAPKEAKIIKSNISAKTHAFNLIKERTKDELLILRINDKNIIDEVYQAFRNDANIVKIYSDSEQVQYAEQDEAILNQVKKGIIPKSVDVLLCTSILDAGISLNVDRHVNCYAISDRYMPNAIDVVQLYARVRTSSHYKMKLTIIGRFGFEPLPEGYSLSSFSPSLLVKIMSDIYQTYSLLDEEAYCGILDYYGIRTNLYNHKEYSISDAKYLCHIKPIQIVKNLHNFERLHKELSDRLQIKSWINFFEGETIINSKETSQVIRLFEQIVDACSMNIHPSLYLDKSYNQKRVKNLIRSVDGFNNSKQFKIVMLQLLNGFDTKEGTKTKMNLDEFKKLSEPYQESIKAVSNLLYYGRKWNEKNITLTRKSDLIEINEYLNNFLWALKNVA